MHKRDFHLLALALSHSSPMFKQGLTVAQRTGRMIQWREDVNAIIAACKLSNHNFNEELFRQECCVPAKIMHNHLTVSNNEEGEEPGEHYVKGE